LNTFFCHINKCFYLPFIDEKTELSSVGDFSRCTKIKIKKIHVDDEGMTDLHHHISLTDRRSRTRTLGASTRYNLLCNLFCNVVADTSCRSCHCATQTDVTCSSSSTFGEGGGVLHEIEHFLHRWRTIFHFDKSEWK
jgi:hypothetical protein